MKTFNKINKVIPYRFYSSAFNINWFLIVAEKEEKITSV